MSKQHISFWIKNSNLKECEINMKSIGCNSRSDYIDRAVEFYNGYIHNKNNEDYVNKNVVNTVQALLDSFEKRLARQMFKQSVEISKIFWLIVKEMEIVPSQQKWTQKSFKKRNESQYFVNLRKPTAFIPRFA